MTEKEAKNPFREGQSVVCISENFPVIKKYGGTGEEATNTPKQGEVLVIDEILGGFLRFNKYDTEESFNWWYYNRFAPVNEKEQEELINELVSDFVTHKGGA
jgi:hypothetical protein